MGAVCPLRGGGCLSIEGWGAVCPLWGGGCLSIEGWGLFVHCGVGVFVNPFGATSQPVLVVISN